MTDTEKQQTAIEGEEDVPMDPLLELLRWKYTYTSAHSSSEQKQEARSRILERLTRDRMVPYYANCCELFGWKQDNALLSKMRADNKTELERITATIRDAEENLGDSEIRDGMQKKCDFYARIGDMEESIKSNDECSTKTLGVGPRLDLCLQRIRLGLAFGDNDVAAKGITDAQKLIKDGDWERRNRLKVYEGLYNVCVRNFTAGCKYLLDSLSTFASTEILTYKEFIFITVAAALISLPRAELKKSIVESPEVLSAGLADMEELVNSIFQCRYKDVFNALDRVCIEFRNSVHLSLHVNYFFREVRVVVFNQFLDSYSSVTLKSMAASFNLSVAVLDNMLFTLISNERIACKIDRVSGNVTTYRGNNTNFQYHQIIKNGDILLNRIQKLSRLIEM